MALSVVHSTHVRSAHGSSETMALHPCSSLAMQAKECSVYAAGNSGNMVVWGAPHLTERADPSGLEFLVSPLSFRQINPRQGQALLRLVADAAGAPLSHSEPHRQCQCAAHGVHGANALPKQVAGSLGSPGI